jgi:hypothetical protein
MNLTRHSSGLLLPAADERSVERELQALDPRLFLTYEIEGGRQVYRVMCEYAGDHFAPVCDWRDEKQQPLPLSSGLIELVRSLRPRGGVTAQEAIAANEKLQARVEADFENEVDEIVGDMAPRMRETRAACLPRGPHLRRARSGQ